jgi:hypothetical protein
LLDVCGCVASVACALHCTALPLLLAVSPVLALRGLRSAWAEWTFVLLSLILGMWSFGPRAASREGHTPLALFLAGGGTLIAVRTLVPQHATHLERLGLLVGAALLASAHLVNRARARRRCACVVCDAHDSPAEMVVADMSP